MKNVGYFVASIVMVLGPLIVAAPNWDFFTTTLGVGSIFVAVGGVLAGAFGVNSKKPTYDPNVN